MIHLFSIDPDAGLVAQVDASDLAAMRRRPGWVWLNAVGASESEIREICTEFGFDRLAVEDVMTGTGHPKSMTTTITRS